MRFPTPGFFAFLLGITAFGQTSPQGPLTFSKPIVAQSEDGASMDGEGFVPGETVYFSYVVNGLKAGPTDRIQLTGHIQAFDPFGVPLSTVDEQVIATTLSQEDKDWKPKIRSQFVIPSIVPPGPYKIHFDAIDAITKRKGEGDAVFSVRTRGVDRPAGFLIQDLGFFRTEEELNPLHVVAYRAGDLLWVRLDITGYKYGEGNAIDVSYDVEVFGPDGKSLFAEPDAAIERSQAFYPQPWVPVEFNLSLKTTMTAGVYTLVVTAHDGIGKQTVSAKGEFKVE